MAGTLAIGLDSSTQSLTAIVIDYERKKIIAQHTLDYARDERLNWYGIHGREYLVPSRVPGEADQPPLMYLASIDAMFEDLKRDGVDLARVAVLNVSGQQHGHVYLGSDAHDAFASLRLKQTGGPTLAERFASMFAYGTAPIWRTSNTAEEAETLRRGAGGKAAMIRLSGSDSPLRFTGAVIRRVGRQFPEAYGKTERIQLISSFVSGVLIGSIDAPIDFGNASGTSLMDYRSRAWSDKLLAAAAAELPGGPRGLAAKLPPLAAPNTIVGTVAAYFTERYGLAADCAVAAGSGDNPQTKVLVPADLLSLGTSFVFMVSTDIVDDEGYANSMYDGVGRPFIFGCRTNGAMVWDRVRALYRLAKKDYEQAEASLAAHAPGSTIFLWQPENESFPVSPAFEARREGYAAPELSADYGGAIDSSLAAVYWYSRHFAAHGAGRSAGARDGHANADARGRGTVAGPGDAREPLYVTGGATSSPEIMRRAAAIWNRPVIAIGGIGAALGAAVAGVSALQRSTGVDGNVDALASALLPAAKPVEPLREDVARYHDSGAYLERFSAAYGRFLG